jgi:hypothetical protein
MTSAHCNFVIGYNAWPRPTVFLTDYAFWHHHQQELTDWCREHGAQQRGMTLTMDESALTLFALRWA